MTPLHEQLRNAADDCTPSPLKDLLNLAADAVDVKQEPVAWASDNVIPLRGLKDNHPAILTATKCVANPIPLYLHPAPIPDGMRLVPVEPTDDMIIRGSESLHDQLHHYFDFDVNLDGSEIQQGVVEFIFSAMLKAAGESS